MGPLSSRLQCVHPRSRLRFALALLMPPLNLKLSLATLFSLEGTQANPVKDIVFSGLTFTGSAMTFLDPHGVPSGGDWALQRSAAIFVEGTEGTAIDACVLERLDG